MSQKRRDVDPVTQRAAAAAARANSAAPLGRRGVAATAPDAADASLRGRTYAVPFEDVWQASLRLADGGLRGWTVLESDDHAGCIIATATRLDGALFDARIDITLDQDAQTRVDGRVSARKPGSDFGSASRRLRRFFRVLDRTLARTPHGSYAAQR